MLKAQSFYWSAFRTYSFHKNVIKSKKPVIQHAGKPLLITCRRPEFNLYRGDKIDTNAEYGSIPLTSSGWHHYKSKGDYFIIHQNQSQDITQNPEYCQPFDKTFDLHPQLLLNLSSRLNMPRTTYIQHKAIPMILANKHTLIAAETGCGKTVAYLLPVVRNLLKLKDSDRDLPVEFNSPKALIITPGRELATQIGEVCEDLCHGLDLKSKILIGGHTKSIMDNPPIEEIDILVASVGSLSKLITTNIYRMHQVRHVIIDEADTLLDDSFSNKLQFVLKRFPVMIKPFVYFFEFSIYTSFSFLTVLQECAKNKSK